MNFFSRLFKVFEANAHSAVDQLEDPVKLAEQGIRDLRKDLDSNIKALAEVKAIAIGIRKDLETKKAQAQDYENKAMLLLKKSQSGELSADEADRLASEALARKEALVSDSARLSNDLAHQDTLVQNMEGQIRQLKSQIGHWENEAKMLKARSKVAGATQKLNKQLARIDSDGTIAMLERMKEKVSTEEALAESYGSIAQIESQEATLDSEINQALSGSVNASGADSLAALKAKMGIESTSTTQALPAGQPE